MVAVPRTSDRVRVILVAVTALAQAVAAPLTTLGLAPGSIIAEIYAANASPVTPAGYAFAVWNVIYAACLVLAIYQLLPGQHDRRVHRRSGWWLAGAFICGTALVPIFGVRVVWLGQLLLVILVICLVFAARGFLIAGPAARIAEIALLRLPVMLYLGWSTLAAAAGFAATFRSWGAPASARWLDEICVVLVLSATIMSLFVVGRLVAIAGFVLTACWALLAIALSTDNDSVRLATVLAIVVLVCAVLGRILRSRQRRVLLFG
jgi:translocator protein